MATRDHTIHVIRHKIEGATVSNIFANLHVHDVEPSLCLVGGSPTTLFQNFLFIYNAIRFGLRLIKDEKIDIIHANNHTPIFVGYFLSKLTSRPLVITIHHVASKNGLKYWKKWVKQFTTSIFSFPLIGYVGELLSLKLPNSAIHTVSDVVCEDILSVNKNAKIAVIPNGLNLEMYPLDNSDIKYNNDILFIGRAVYYKNLDTILKAMKIVVKSNRSTRLIVVGDGPMKPSWEKLAVKYGLREKVMFVGYVSPVEKLNFLKNSRMLVLPSTLEGFGMVILEAWSCKKPVIVSGRSPLSDLVDDGKTGFHVDPFLYEEWAEKISNLLSDECLAKTIGTAGFLHLHKKYGIKTTVDCIENLYKTCLLH